jgi:hypothetical protein
MRARCRSATWPNGSAPSTSRRLEGQLSQFWQIETEPAERRKLLLSLFEQVWARDGRIVAVQPHEDFLPYFQAASRFRKQGNGRGAKSGSDGCRALVWHPIEIRHGQTLHAAPKVPPAEGSESAASGKYNFVILSP